MHARFLFRLVHNTRFLFRCNARFLFRLLRGYPDRHLLTASLVAHRSSDLLAFYIVEGLQPLLTFRYVSHLRGAYSEKTAQEVGVEVFRQVSAVSSHPHPLGFRGANNGAIKGDSAPLSAAVLCPGLIVRLLKACNTVPTRWVFARCFVPRDLHSWSVPRKAPCQSSV
jgi:hypothetical protein